MDNAAQVETEKDFDNMDQSERDVARWLAEINSYEKSFETWKKRCAAIVKRYRDDAESVLDTEFVKSGKAQFNILWSNVQVLQPAVYGRDPKPEVVRRYKDRDPIGLAASEILERCLTTSIDMQPFGDSIKAARDDYLLCGRGTVWVRYVPHFGEEKRETVYLQRVQGDLDEESGEYGEDTYTHESGEAYEEDPENPMQFDDANEPFILGDSYRPIVHEEVVVDYINYKDFGHTPSTVWGKVPTVWRREEMTRDQLVKRFGKEIGEQVNLTKSVSNVDEKALNNYADIFKRAEVYEIWCSQRRKVYWISPGYHKGPLDVKDDPLKLRGFFPCPKPLYSTLTHDTLVPVPDYVQYQSQANEVDELTARIDLLTQALKVSGAYDSSFEELGEILKGGDNKLVPVDNWAMFADKGGLKGVMTFLPIKEIAEVITILGDQRIKAKQDLYEITGISDIIRGQSNPNETLGAQRIKGQFASLRLEDRQSAVAEFVRDTIRIMAEIISEHFQPNTIKEMSGWMGTTSAKNADKRNAEAMQQIAQAQQSAMNQMMQSQAAQQQQMVQPPPAEMFSPMTLNAGPAQVSAQPALEAAAPGMGVPQ